MPIHVSWDDAAHNAVRFDIEGHWTWDEFFPAYDEANALINSVDHVVSLIFHPDRTAALHYPPDMASHTRSIDRQRHPRTGLSFTVTEQAGAVIRTMVKMASILLAKDRQTIFVSTLAEARARAAAHRQQASTTDR